MSRRHHWFQLRDENGIPISDANIHLYLKDTETEASIYSTSVALSAGDLIEQNTFSTNSSGWFDFYIGDEWEESPSVGYEADQWFDLEWTGYIFGENLIANGSFDANNSDGWTFQATGDWTVSSNRLECQNSLYSGSVAYYLFPTPLESGKKYRITFDVLKFEKTAGGSHAGNANISLWLAGGGVSVYKVAENLELTAGTTYSTICTATGDHQWLYIVQYSDLNGAFDNFELVELTETGKSGKIEDLQLLPQVFPVDETDSTNAVENKLISNQLAYTWEAHRTETYETEPHNVQPVDENDSSGASYDKLVSNYLINKIKTDLDDILASGNAGVTIEASLGPEQITNNDFEETFTDTSPELPAANNWTATTNATGANPIINQDFADFYAGTASLAVSCNHQDEGIRANTKSTVTAGDTMRWSGYIKYDSATLEDGEQGHGVLSIQIIDGDGATSLHTEEITSASSAYYDTWEYWTVDTDILTTGASATCTFKQSDSRPVAFKLDNFSCKEKFTDILIDTETYTQSDLSTSGSEYILNLFPGDMETVTGDPVMPHNAGIGATWTSLGIASGETNQDSDADEGSYSLGIRPVAPAEEGDLYIQTNEFGVDQDLTYKLYYAARTIPSGGGGAIDVIMYDGDGSIVRTDTIPSGASTWTDYTTFWQPTITGSSAKVRFQPKDRGNQKKALAWWKLDDMKLYSIPSGSFYVDFEHDLKRSKLYPIVQVWSTVTDEKIQPYEIMDINNKTLRVWLKQGTGIACTVTGEVSGS